MLFIQLGLVCVGLMAYSLYFTYKRNNGLKAKDVVFTILAYVVIFGIFGTGVYAFNTNNMNLCYICFGAFALFVICGILYASVLRKIIVNKILKVKGKEATGVFIQAILHSGKTVRTPAKYESASDYNVDIQYLDENGFEKIATTSEAYTREQLEYIASLQTIHILVKDKSCKILDKIPSKITPDMITCTDIKIVGDLPNSPKQFIDMVKPKYWLNILWK